MTGGFRGALGAPTPITELYDPGSDVWSAEAVTQRWHHAAVLLHDGRVLVAGGVVGVTRLATAELWTPTTALTASPSVAFANAGASSISFTNTGDSTLFTDAYALARRQPG